MSLQGFQYENNLRESDDEYDLSNYPYMKKSKYENIDKQINEIDYEIEKIKPKSFNLKADKKEIIKILQDTKSNRGLIEHEDKLYSLIMKEPIIKKENFLRSISKTVIGKEMETLNLKLLDYSVLKEIMDTCGSFPEKSRNYIWKFLLSLPCDKSLFDFYKTKGIHPFYKNLEEIFSLKRGNDYQRLQQMCSIISHWSPHIGNVYFLPDLIFPFVKSIKGDDLFLFEILIAFLNTYCQYWFEFHPGAPLNHLKLCEKIILKESKKLFLHLKKIDEESCDCSMKITELIWRLMKKIFSETLCKENWQQLIDFILTRNHKPEILLYFASSFLISLEGILLKCKTKEDVENFLFVSECNRDFNFNLRKIFKNSLNLMEKYSRYQIYKYKPHIPFPDGKYPSIDKFPLDFLGTTAKLREELFKEEQNFITKQEQIDEIEKKFMELAKREKMMQRSYESMIHKEKEKSFLMKRELDVIIYQKEKFYEELKNRKLEKIGKLEKLIDSSVKLYDKMNQTELATVEDDLRKKKILEELDIKQRLQQEELNNLEYDANRKILQLMNLRIKDESEQSQKLFTETKEKEREINKTILEANWKLEDEAMRNKMEYIKNLKELDYMQNIQGNDSLKSFIKEKIREYDQQLLIEQVEMERKNRKKVEFDDDYKTEIKENPNGEKNNYTNRINVNEDNSKENKNDRHRNKKEEINKRSEDNNNNNANYDYPYQLDRETFFNNEGDRKNNYTSSYQNEFSSPTLSSDNKNSTKTNLKLINEGIRNLTSSNNLYSSSSLSKNDALYPHKNNQKPQNFNNNNNLIKHEDNYDIMTSSYKSDDELELEDKKIKAKYEENIKKKNKEIPKNLQKKIESPTSLIKSKNIASLGSLSLSDSYN